MFRISELCVFAMLLVFAFPCRGQQPGQRPDREPDQKSMGSNFLEAARAVTASIQEKYFIEQSGLYAQSLEKREPEFMWGNGVMFSALVAAARHDPETYKPILDRFFKELDRYWDSKAKIPGYEPAPTSGNGNDKYYDDNQWMVIAFMEAYDLTGDDKFLNRADETLKFSLGGWDDQLGGGIWWHEQHKDGSKNTCANAPAAVGCLRIARYRESKQYVEWARKIAKWTTEHLQDRDGLFFDNQKVADGKIEKTKWTYNTALMTRAYLGLWRATRDQRFLAEAKRIGAASSAFLKPKAGAYRDGYKFTHLLVEADLELYRATGDRVILERARKNGEAAWKQWQSSPPKELIEQASIARMLWLLADHETDVGREFWKKADVALGAGS